ncbi:PLDc N-terminal domain-containing protein [Arthrobacter sp. TMS1-12-1]
MEINVWEITWAVFSVVLFAAYLALVFIVLSDIISNQALSRGWRALWVVLLVVLPFVASIAYLFVHGQTMALRTSRGFRSEAGPEGPPGSHDPTAQVASANELLRQGAITSDEYERLKKHALQQASRALPADPAPRTTTG